MNYYKIVADGELLCTYAANYITDPLLSIASLGDLDVDDLHFTKITKEEFDKLKIIIKENNLKKETHEAN